MHEFTLLFLSQHQCLPDMMPCQRKSTVIQLIGRKIFLVTDHFGLNTISTKLGMPFRTVVSRFIPHRIDEMFPEPHLVHAWSPFSTREKKLLLRKARKEAAGICHHHFHKTFVPMSHRHFFGLGIGFSIGVDVGVGVGFGVGVGVDVGVGVSLGVGFGLDWQRYHRAFFSCLWREGEMFVLVKCFLKLLKTFYKLCCFLWWSSFESKFCGAVKFIQKHKSCKHYPHFSLKAKRTHWSYMLNGKALVILRPQKYCILILRQALMRVRKLIVLTPCLT